MSRRCVEGEQNGRARDCDPEEEGVVDLIMPMTAGEEFRQFVGLAALGLKKDVVSVLDHSFQEGTGLAWCFRAWHGCQLLERRTKAAWVREQVAQRKLRRRPALATAL